MAKHPKISLARRTCRLAERAFHASARLLDQLGYPTGSTQRGASAADDLASSELAIAVTLLSGELFECGIAPEIG